MSDVAYDAVLRSLQDAELMRRMNLDDESLAEMRMVIGQTLRDLLGDQYE